MKCSKCMQKNKNFANYCIKCGKKFTKEEKETAEKKSLVSRLDKIKTTYEFITLKKITDDIRFKIVCIIIILSFGLFMLFTNKNKMDVIETTAYEVVYNKESKIYYILANDTNVDTIGLELYLPNRIDNLEVAYYDNANNLITKKNYERTETIKIDINETEDNYYKITNVNNKDESLKLLVYYKEYLTIEEN